MSEQVKRYSFKGAAGLYVYEGDCDALAQRCRELEAERNHFAIQAQRFYNERDTLRAEVEEARRTAGFWKDEHLAGNRVIDQLRAEVTSLKDKNEDLVFALSDAESRANNAGRNATAFEDRMGDLQVANGNLRDEIAQYRDIAYARVDECGKLRAEIADLKAALLEADRGNEELVRLRANERDLRKLLAECTDYLNINKYTSIGHGSILHRKMMEASQEKAPE